jgi:rubrerythrin
LADRRNMLPAFCIDMTSVIDSRKAEKQEEGMEFQNTKTYQNLIQAYGRELEASGKYEFYAGKAEREGYRQMAEVFRETAANERAHAQIWYRWIHGGEEPGIRKNLEEAAAGERDEWTRMYQDFANIARCEGQDEIARLFEQVGLIERHHDFRYRKLTENLYKKQAFSSPRETVWICTNCGHMERGFAAPEKCPVCGHPVGFFERLCENF